MCFKCYTFVQLIKPYLIVQNNYLIFGHYIYIHFVFIVHSCLTQLTHNRVTTCLATWSLCCFLNFLKLILKIMVEMFNSTFVAKTF